MNRKLNLLLISIGKKKTKFIRVTVLFYKTEDIIVTKKNSSG